MNIIQFQQGYNHTLATYGRWCNSKLIDYCQSVFEECKETMSDEELAQMLDDYYNCLLSSGAVGLFPEMEEIVQLREQVYHRLADKSMVRYGVQWADAWFTRAYENSAPLEEYDAIFALFRILKEVYGCDVNFTMTRYISRIACECSQKGLHKQTIRYASDALELYYEELLKDIDVFVWMEIMYDLIGESYLALGQSERAEENFAQAQKMDAKAKELEDYYSHLAEEA